MLHIFMYPVSGGVMRDTWLSASSVTHRHQPEALLVLGVHTTSRILRQAPELDFRSEYYW
jgi:hypothetical protein